MDDTTILGGTLNQLGQTVKQTVKQVTKLPEEMAKDLGGQIGGVKNPPTAGEKPAQNPKKEWQSDEERIKFLKGLYGSDKNANPNPPAGGKLTDFQEQIADKPPEEQKKLMELRNKLHKEVYYDPTFNPVKKQEERPAEKVETEKKQEMDELQKKEEKKPPPLAVVREQNKTEMFRGASG